MSTVAPGTGFVGQASPAKQVRVSGTNLFRVAARELGDATQWYRIAQLNDISDPWITTETTLLIPPPGVSNGGIPTG